MHLIDRCSYIPLIKGDIKAQVTIHLELLSIISEWDLISYLEMLFCYPSFRCNFLKVFRTNNGNVGTCIISTNTCAGTPATSATTFLDWLSLSLTHTTPTILSLESKKVCPWGEVFLHRHDSLSCSAREILSFTHISKFVIAQLYPQDSIT